MLRAVALVVVVAFAVYFVVANWTAIRQAVRGLDPWLAVASLTVAVVGLAGSTLSWRAILGGLGSTLPLRAGARIYFLGQLGKYVPGSVWPVLAQAEMSREHGVPRSRAAFAAAAQLAVSLASGVAVSAIALALSSRATLVAYWWLIPVAVAVAATLVPPVFNRVVALAMRLGRRPPAEPVTGRALASSTAWCVVMWAAFGTHAWLLALALGRDAPWLLATGAYALAWSVGFVIVFLPAGAGAREAALTLALSSALPREAALALALVSRVLMLVADFACAGVAALAVRRRRAVSAGTGSP